MSKNTFRNSIIKSHYDIIEYKLSHALLVKEPIKLSSLHEMVVGAYYQGQEDLIKELKKNGVVSLGGILE